MTNTIQRTPTCVGLLYRIDIASINNNVQLFGPQKTARITPTESIDTPTGAHQSAAGRRRAMGD